MAAEIYLNVAVNGILTGLVYGLMALGLSVIFGVVRVVNFAHGSLYMLGMYLAVWLSGRVGFWTAVPLAALAVAGVGFVVEFFILKKIYKAPELLQLLATFALVLVIKDAALWAWGPEDLLGPRAPGLQGAIRIGGAAFPEYDLLLMALGLIVIFSSSNQSLARVTSQTINMLVALGVMYVFANIPPH